VILMDAPFDFTSPDAATTKFIRVSSLSHENVAIFEVVLFNVIWQHLNGLNF
jgi:hypothetical protein